LSPCCNINEGKLLEVIDLNIKKNRETLEEKFFNATVKENKEILEELYFGEGEKNV
jgi:hypothetical protein